MLFLLTLSWHGYLIPLYCTVGPQNITFVKISLICVCMYESMQVFINKFVHIYKFGITQKQYRVV